MEAKIGAERRLQRLEPGPKGSPEDGMARHRNGRVSTSGSATSQARLPSW